MSKAKKLNAHFIKIVSLLNDGEFHDGDTIGKTLHMTRSAIWKTIKKLVEYKIEVQAVKGKGYALLESLNLLDEKKIKEGLVEKDISVNVFESIDSTVTYLKSISSHKDHFCLAEYQTEGRGRLQRQWYSPFGKNIYLSCLFHFEKDVSELSGLSLVAGLAVLQTLKHYRDDPKLCIKWPNDILYDGKKLAGILVEIQAETHGICHAIVSVGLNVNMRKDQNQTISQSWTSLLKILGHAVDRNDLCIRLINQLISAIQHFNTKGFASFIPEWLAHDFLLNRSLTLDTPKQRISGLAKGINQQGHLLLQLPSGEVQAFSAGDVSIINNGPTRNRQPFFQCVYIFLDC